MNLYQNLMKIFLEFYESRYYIDFQMALFTWCMAPIERNGSKFIYGHVILPWFLKNQDRLETAFDRSKKVASDAVNEAEKLAKEAAAEALLKND